MSDRQHLYCRQSQSHWSVGINNEIVETITSSQQQVRKKLKNHPFQLELHDHIMRSATSVTVKQTAKDYYNDKPCYRSQHYQNQLPCGVFGLVRRSRLGCGGHVNFTEHTLPADLTALCTYASSSVTDMGNTRRITNVRTQSPKISSLASIGACPVNAFTMTTVFPAGFVTFTSG